MPSVRNQAVITLIFEGKDLDQRAACASVMAAIQQVIVDLKLPVQTWELESFRNAPKGIPCG